MLNTKQLEAERAVHQALDAGDETMLEAFADFAAGEIDDKHIAALLLAILSQDPFGGAAEAYTALRTIEHELERQRAAFIEHQARVMLRNEEAHQDATAEIDQEFRNAQL